ncbi:penicillin-binding protein activator [Rhodopila sp.]|uniref:penicillin-binding protein activator n=1 Tax=Rhodopila sp. TaxID=2480087 RepID=UPI002BC71ED9|nr:penicillin-binding protein activator [Rhodopila sp.]HVZ09409.1 penicillin-binding protein activator [Rhodopila sp.]
MRSRAYSLLVFVLVLGGCTAGAPQYGYQTSGAASRAGGPVSMAAPGGMPGPLEGGQRVALLAPMTGPRADLGQVLKQAALLVLPESNLDVIDTGGTASGAASAAQAAIAHGSRVIIGPLTSSETAAVAPIAKQAGVPVLAFTNDPAQSQPGVWPLGVTPGQQVRRLVAAAQGQGKTSFAALLPESDFGHAMGTALSQAVQTAGLPPPVIRMHGAGMQAISTATRDLSGYASRRGPIDARIRQAREAGTAEGRKEARELGRSSIPPPSFNVLLLADTGEALSEIASVLPYYDVDRSAVQIIGPAIWSSPASGSAAVSGAWYAAPDASSRSALEQGFSAKYGVPAPPLADLAFDAASIARLMLHGNGADTGVLTQPAGFVGADGWIAFSADGHVRRGLAVYKITGGSSVLIEPAPQAPSTPGS